MILCANCHNLLILENNGLRNTLNCKACPYVYDLTKKIVKTYKNQTKTPDKLVYGGENELKYAAKCVKCNCEIAMYIEMQTRSADEPMTIFYQCVECRTTWKE
ncbi:hypothetical protein EDEG_05088 [Edhazardia aedis USNM 41457]|uniref:DNA-directed RNA polymerase subunit n=1 Tax=Edhazardia aedis (strain USNM 41457) TaxID=1003232 RepID=A0A0L1P7B1_EDHAE|nr:hypothetical protein EDEG_05088 [Edhazardia aedis USNM 41457]|eukprot:KNH48529.1 hypothetical protein EDEG_05088 [Edhazardia aedis USNM 41457]